MKAFELNETVNKIFRDALQDMFEEAVTVIRAEQRNAPMPDTDVFMSVKIQLTGATGRDEVKYKNRPTVDLDQVVSGRRTGFASINIFNKDDHPTRDNPMDMAEQIKLSLQDPNLASHLTAQGVGLQAIGSPTDISAIENGEYEGRAAMTVDFNVDVQRVSTVLEIQGIRIYGGVEVDGVNFPVDLQISE